MKMRNKSKRTLSMIIVLLLLFNGSIIVKADNTGRLTKEYFLSLNEKEIVDFLINNDVPFPSNEITPYYYGEFAKRVVTLILNYEDFYFAINSEVTRQFAENIRDCVYSVLGYNLSINTSLRYSLQYSTRVGSWNSVYGSYNCFGFALGTTNWYRVGGPGGAGTWIAGSTSLSTAVSWIQQDLTALGYTIHSVTTYIPSVSSGQQLICYRQGPSDYHFMRYISSIGAWRHKPGATLPLQYLYTPRYGTYWYNEYSKEGVDYPASTYYSGTIYYFVIS